MTDDAAGREDAPIGRLLDRLCDAALGHGIDCRFQPIEQRVKLLVLVIGHHVPAATWPLRIGNNFFVGYGLPMWRAILIETPATIDLANGTSAMNFDADGNEVRVPGLAAGRKASMPRPAGVIAVPVNGGQLYNALGGRST